MKLLILIAWLMETRSDYFSCYDLISGFYCPIQIKKILRSTQWSLFYGSKLINRVYFSLTGLVYKRWCYEIFQQLLYQFTRTDEKWLVSALLIIVHKLYDIQLSGDTMSWLHWLITRLSQLGNISWKNVMIHKRNSWFMYFLGDLQYLKGFTCKTHEKLKVEDKSLICS